MDNIQKRIMTNIGFDSHVRSYNQNLFNEQSFLSKEMIAGEILLPQPEPLYRQNMVTVQLARGGQITSVAYPGAFIDPYTGNMHGMYEGPIPGQMVIIGFENGNSSAPFVVNRYPYQGVGNTFIESEYMTPLTMGLYHSSDVIIGHFSGSYMSFNTGIAPSIELPGSITISAFTDCNISSQTNAVLEAIVSAEITSPATTVNGDATLDLTGAAITITGDVTAEITSPATTVNGDTTLDITSLLVSITGDTAIELNGNTKTFVTHAELNTALQTFMTALNLHTHPTAGTGAPSPPTVPMTLDISLATTTTVKTG